MGYEDNPEARKAVWETAPRAVDKYGNKLIKIGHYWCSYDFNRLFQLAREECKDGQQIITVRVADGRCFSRPRSSFMQGKASWQRRVNSGWYVFIDPITQQVYQ